MENSFNSMPFTPNSMHIDDPFIELASDAAMVAVSSSVVPATKPNYGQSHLRNATPPNASETFRMSTDQLKSLYKTPENTLMQMTRYCIKEYIKKRVERLTSVCDNCASKNDPKFIKSHQICFQCASKTTKLNWYYHLVSAMSSPLEKLPYRYPYAFFSVFVHLFEMHRQAPRTDPLIVSDETVDAHMMALVNIEKGRGNTMLYGLTFDEIDSQKSKIYSSDLNQLDMYIDFNHAHINWLDRALGRLVHEQFRQEQERCFHNAPFMDFIEEEEENAKSKNDESSIPLLFETKTEEYDWFGVGHE